MLCSEIIAVFFSGALAKHINTLWGHNVEFLHVKPDGTKSNRQALKGSGSQTELLFVSHSNVH